MLEINLINNEYAFTPCRGYADLYMTQNEGVCLMQDPSRGCHRTDETVQYVFGKIKTMSLGSKVGNISPALLEASAATHWTLPDRATIAYDWDQCQRRAVTAIQVWACKIFDHK